MSYFFTKWMKESLQPVVFQMKLRFYRSALYRQADSISASIRCRHYRCRLVNWSCVAEHSSSLWLLHSSSVCTSDWQLRTSYIRWTPARIPIPTMRPRLRWYPSVIRLRCLESFVIVIVRMRRHWKRGGSSSKPTSTYFDFIASEVHIYISRMTNLKFITFICFSCTNCTTDTIFWMQCDPR